MKKLTLFLITLAVCLGQAIAPAPTTYSSLPTASTVPNQLRTVTDCSTSVCTAGGGSIRAVVQSTGSAWAVVGSGLTKSGPYMYDGSSSAYYLPFLYMYPATLPSSGSTVGSGSGTVAASGSFRKITFTGSGSGASYTAEVSSIGANTSHIEAFTCATSWGWSAVGDFGGSGATPTPVSTGGCFTFIRESSSGKAVGCGMSPSNSARALGLECIGFSSNTASSLELRTTYYPVHGNALLIRARVDGTRFYFDVCESDCNADSNLWITIFRDTYANWFTTAPDQWGSGVTEPYNYGDVVVMSTLSRNN